MEDNGAVEVDVGSVSAMTTNHLVSWDVYARNLDDGIYNVIDLYNQPMGYDNQENIETRATTEKHSNNNTIEKKATNCREEKNWNELILSSQVISSIYCKYE